MRHYPPDKVMPWVLAAVNKVTLIADHQSSDYRTAYLLTTNPVATGQPILLNWYCTYYY